MMFLSFFLGGVGIVFILVGLRTVFFVKEFVLTSRLRDILFLGFFYAAFKARYTEAAQYKLIGRKRILLGIVFLSIGVFLLYSALWLYLTT